MGAEIADHRARRRARQDVLILYKALSSWEDQQEVFKVIQGYFVPNRQDLKLAEEVARRAACLKAVRQVAEHLGLRENEAPGVMQYETARKELGLGLSVWVILRRWYSWYEVRKALRGETVRKTAHERSRFQAAIRRKPTGVEWLAGVKEWLETRPHSLLALDYDDWTVARNGVQGLPPVSKTPAINKALGLSWRETLKVAKGDLSLSAAQARNKKKLKRECGGFVGVHGVAVIRGFTQHQASYHTQADGTFPPYVFKLNDARVWYWEDVEAHHKGQPFPKRKRGELQNEVLNVKDIMRLCELKGRQLSDALYSRSSTTPRPAGNISKRYYWWRTDVQAWLDERAKS